jgi:hypothetical protein
VVHSESDIVLSPIVSIHDTSFQAVLILFRDHLEVGMVVFMVYARIQGILVVQDILVERVY